jgi:16S rRNA (cytosine1402-N4)-methyltransferase
VTASAAVHEPVMVQQVLAALNVQPGGRYVDCTVDGGGHAEAILERASPGGSLLGLDADPEAIAIAGRRLARFGDAVALVNANFREVDEVCRRQGFLPVNGILFDLGLSSLQLANASRGFSFLREGPIDMRFGPTGEWSAAHWVNEAPEEELAAVLWRFGEERQSRRVAREVVKSRPLRTTTELAKAVERAVGRGRKGQIHPATRTFQALRIAANQELAALSEALPRTHGLLDGFGARLVVISYHSLEDRIVKQYIARESRDCVCPPEQVICACGHKATLRPVTRGAARPTSEEVAANPRSRSARLRAAERLPPV